SICLRSLSAFEPKKSLIKLATISICDFSYFGVVYVNLTKVMISFKTAKYCGGDITPRRNIFSSAELPSRQ
ncbi:MAG: hypothetical protein ACLS84_12405, partial [Alistipes onderdonkii]